MNSDNLIQLPDGSVAAEATPDPRAIYDTEEKKLAYIEEQESSKNRLLWEISELEKSVSICDTNIANMTALLSA